jgi:hypothetical protein
MPKMPNPCHKSETFLKKKKKNNNNYSKNYKKVSILWHGFGIFGIFWLGGLFGS